MKVYEADQRELKQKEAQVKSLSLIFERGEIIELDI
jgi:hypothetical protein